MNSYIFLFSSLILMLYTHLVLKIGVGRISIEQTGGEFYLLFIFNAFKSPLILTGILAAALSSCCWLLTLKNMPLSQAYPFMALLFLLMPIGSSIVLGESLSLGKIVGGILIIIGVVITNKL